MFVLLLALCMGDLPSSAPPYEEEVVVDGAPLYVIEHQVSIRSASGQVYDDIEPAWLDVKLRCGKPTTDIQIHRFRGPAALTVLLDTSASMVRAREKAAALVEALLLALPEGDYVRVVAFNDETSFTRWAEAGALRAELLRQLLTVSSRQSASKRPWACLRDEAGPPSTFDEWLPSWIEDCSVGEQRAMERQAAARFVARLQARTGATIPGAAVSDALAGFLPSEHLPFVPGFESTLGLVIISDDGFAGAIDPWAEALLETLLVQRYQFAASGSVIALRAGPEAVNAGLGEESADVVAARVVQALHSCLVLTVESEAPELLRRNAIDVSCRRPDGRPAHVLMTMEALPPLDVLRAAATPGADGNRSARQVVGELVRADALPSRVLPLLMDKLGRRDPPASGPNRAPW
jgi:hypothetical protein